MDELATERWITPQSKGYRDRKASLQRDWRRRVFERDGHRCRACNREGTDDTLHLAHVTPALRFVQHSRSLEGMDNSYREDNLVTLCVGCHKLQHHDVDSAFNPDLAALIARADEMRKHPEVQEWLTLRGQIDNLFENERQDAPRRRALVEKLFREIRDARGWRSPEGLDALHDGIPSWGGLRTPSDKCYEPSGGPKKRERVALGFCTYEARTCQGPSRRCDDCGLPFCEYHAPTHRRN